MSAADYKEFTEFDKQILLYAKSWYEETDTMMDLKIIISKICGLEVHHVADLDVVMQVSGTMHKVIARSQMNMGDIEKLYKDVWRDPTVFFGVKKAITMVDMVESFLSVMRFKRREYYCELPMPDAKYLPIRQPEGLKERFSSVEKKD